MKIKLKIMTTLLGVFFGCGIAASQTPKAGQAMDSKRQHIAEVAALTSTGDLDKLTTVLIDGLNDGMTVSELKEVMVHPAVSTNVDAIFSQKFRAFRQMRRKPTMQYWLRKSRYSSKNISSPTFSSGMY